MHDARHHHDSVGRVKELPPPDDRFQQKLQEVAEGGSRSFRHLMIGSSRSSKKWRKLQKVAEAPKSGGSSIK